MTARKISNVRTSPINCMLISSGLQKIAELHLGITSSKTCQGELNV